MSISIKITDAGIAEIINASHTGTDSVKIVSIGLGSGQYDIDTAQTALQDEFKRLTATASSNVSDKTIRVQATDTSSESYSVYELGLYTESGTLFAVYSQTAPIIEKSSTSVKFEFDLEFSNYMQFSAEMPEYYTCETVNKSAKTWSGYKWTSTNSIWERSNTVTEGLIYGNGYTPVPSKTYNKDATIQVTSLYNFNPSVEGSIPTGYVMYVPFKSDLNPTTGQAILDQEGTVTFETVLGWPCAHFTDGATVRYRNNLDGDIRDRRYTVSFWFYIDEDPSQLQSDKLFRCLFDTANSGNFSARGSVIVDVIYDRCRLMLWRGSNTCETGFLFRGWNHVILNAKEAGVDGNNSENVPGDIWINGTKHKTQHNNGGWYLRSDSWIRVAGHKQSEMGDYCADETKADSKYTTTDAYFGPFVMYDRTLTDEECRMLWHSRVKIIPSPIFQDPGGSHFYPIGGSYVSDSSTNYNVEGLCYTELTSTANIFSVAKGLVGLTTWTIHARLYPNSNLDSYPWCFLVGGHGSENCVKFFYAKYSDSTYKPAFVMYMNGAKVTWVGEMGPVDNTKGHYMAITYDGTTAKGYIDGVLYETAQVEGFTFYSDYILGGDYTSSYYEDLRIYNECLTEDQIGQLVTAQNPVLA